MGRASAVNTSTAKPYLDAKRLGERQLLGGRNEWEARVISDIELDLVRHGGAGLRTFLNISDVWGLTYEERLRLIGKSHAAEFEQWSRSVRAHEPVAIPLEVIRRIGCVLSIYASLVTLFSGEPNANWLRSPNDAPIFKGESALTVMTRGGLEHLDLVAKYLLAQVHGNA